MNKIIYIGLIIISFVACNSAKTNAELTAKELKVQQLVERQSFKIEMNWAYPQTSAALNQLSNSGLLGAGNSATRINVSSTANFLKIEGTKVSASLPYYGERQFGGSYNPTDIGIRFDGMPTDFQISKDEKKNRTEINFKINGAKNELYNVTVRVFPKGTSNVVVSSSSRRTISYDGAISEIESGN